MSEESRAEMKLLSSWNTVVVTGGCGFIGRYLAEALAEMGKQVNVACICMASDWTQFLVHRIQVRVLDVHCTFEDQRIEFIIGDVRNLEMLKEAFQGADVVFHLAALTSPLGSRQGFFAVNFEGTKNVIQVRGNSFESSAVLHKNSETSCRLASLQKSKS